MFRFRMFLIEDMRTEFSIIKFEQARRQTFEENSITGQLLLLAPR